MEKNCLVVDIIEFSITRCVFYSEDFLNCIEFHTFAESSSSHGFKFA